jgi:hypothetical protein
MSPQIPCLVSASAVKEIGVAQGSGFSSLPRVNVPLYGSKINVE